jgi:AcrR family transcriptional regulator
MSRPADKRAASLERLVTDGGISHTGRGRVVREQVLDMQRARVLNALAHVAAERGIRRTTVSSVLAHDGIPRAVFYEMFKGLDDCFLALLHDVMGRAMRLMVEAFERERSWSDGVVGGLAALLVYLDAEPVFARVCLVETLAAGSAALEHRARELKALEPLVEAGRQHGSDRDDPSTLDAEGTIAAVTGILHAQLVAGKAPPFVDLLGPLATFVLAQRLNRQSVVDGAAKAEQLARDLTRESDAQPPKNHVEMKLPKSLFHPKAFRARSCVLSLADHPEASNKAIAASIDLPHHGQMSKLLRRLEREGLLAKRAGGAGRPNAWWLTSHGEQAAWALKDMQRGVVRQDAIQSGLNASRDDSAYNHEGKGDVTGVGCG